MVDELPKEVPPVKNKSMNRQDITPWERPDTGGDPFDRARGNYSKTPPVRDDDMFAPFGDY